MSFEVVMGGNKSGDFKKSKDLKEGESVEGYLIGLPETKYGFSIALLSKESKLLKLFPHGNLNYIGLNIEDGEVLLNAYTKITRTGTRVSDKVRDRDTGEWMQVPVFQVAQDKADLTSDQDAAAALAAANSSDEDSSKSSKLANRSRR